VSASIATVIICADTTQRGYSSPHEVAKCGNIAEKSARVHKTVFTIRYIRQERERRYRCVHAIVFCLPQYRIYFIANICMICTAETRRRTWSRSSTRYAPALSSVFLSHNMLSLSVYLK
jgi:hypothetical protein